MPTLNASGTVVSIVEDGDKVTIGIESRRKLEDGSPSFKLAYEFPVGSPTIAIYPLDTIVEFAITTTPPAVDQVTSTTTLQSASAEVPAEAPETTPEAPVVDATTPAVPQAGFANTGIDAVKDMLGIPGGTDQGPAPTTGTITPSA